MILIAVTFVPSQLLSGMQSMLQSTTCGCRLRRVGATVIRFGCFDLLLSRVHDNIHVTLTAQVASYFFIHSIYCCLFTIHYRELLYWGSTSCAILVLSGFSHASGRHGSTKRALRGILTEYRNGVWQIMRLRAEGHCSSRI